MPVEGRSHAIHIVVVQSCHQIGLSHIEIGQSVGSLTFIRRQAQTFLLVVVIVALQLIFKFTCFNLCNMLESKATLLGICNIELDVVSLLDVNESGFFSPEVL